VTTKKTSKPKPKAPKYKLLENNPRVRRESDKLAIRKSLESLKAGRSALAAKDGTILCGNGTYEQVQELGIPTLEVETEGEVYVIVKRKDLDPDSDEAKLMVIADNKTGDRSTFDFEAVSKQFQALVEAGVDIGVAGFEDHEIQPLLEMEWAPPAAVGDGQSSKRKVTCPSCGHTFEV